MKTESPPRDLFTGTCALARVLLLAVGAYAAGLQLGCCEDAAWGAERAEGERNAEALGIYFLSPSSGTAGTVVDIRGYGFSTTASGNQVAFNGHPAIVLSASTDSIRTIVPAIATSGPVTITNSNGTAVSAQSFIVRALSSR
jgi:IPT/TIG domain-containing protein